MLCFLSDKNLVDRWECRFGYGNVKAKDRAKKTVNGYVDCSGKPARAVPGFTYEGGKLKFEGERDDPHAIPSMTSIANAYQANIDLQLITGMTEDVSLIPDDETFTQWSQKFVKECTPPEDWSQATAALKNRKQIAEAFCSYDFLNASHNSTIIAQYICGYACKAEMTPSDAAKMMELMVDDINADENETVASLARRMSSSLIKAREISHAEAVMLLQMQPMVIASKTCVRIGHPSSRKFKKKVDLDRAEKKKMEKKLERQKDSENNEDTDDSKKVHHKSKQTTHDNNGEDESGPAGTDEEESCELLDSSYGMYMKTCVAEYNKKNNLLDDEAREAYKLTTFDQHCRKKDVNVPANSKGNKQYPMYQFGSSRPVYPITEAHAQFLCTLHTPGVRKWKDILGNYDSYLEKCTAMLDGVDSNRFPLYVVKKLMRACKVYAYRKLTERNSKGERKGAADAKKNNNKKKKKDKPPADPGHLISLSVSEDEDEDDDMNRHDSFDDEKSALEKKDAINNYEVEDEFHNIYRENDDENQFDLKKLMDGIDRPPDGMYAKVGYDMGVVGSPFQIDFNGAVRWFEKLQKTTKNPTTSTFSLPKMATDEYFDPVHCMDNEGQRHYLCTHLLHLQKIIEAKDTDESEYGDGGTPSPFHHILVGVAGTGKSFVMRLNRAFYRIAFMEQSAEKAIAPTGVAACGIGGQTIHALLSISTKKKGKKVSDLFVETNLKNLKAKQDQLQHTQLIQLDEYSMVGLKLMGKLATQLGRFMHGGEFERDNVASLGNVNTFSLVGDPMQLPPVLDKPCYKKTSSKQHFTQKRPTPAEIAGKLVYHKCREQVLQLNKQMRQSSENNIFTNLLKALRNKDLCNNGKLQKKLTKVLQRMHVRPNREEFNISDTKTLFLSCTRSVVATDTIKYLQTRRDIVRLQSIDTTDGGTVHKTGALKNTPAMAYFSKLGLVKLKKNIAPELGLCNNTRGTVQHILYQSGTNLDNKYKSVDQEAVVIVDFPDYVGPPLWEGAPSTWVAIPRIESRCERNCCVRKGFPLVCGKCDTIHSSQGITVGQGKQFERIRLTWNQRMERLAAGLMYVGLSRAKSIDNIMLSNKFSYENMEAIASTPAFHEALTEETALRERATQQEKDRVQEQQRNFVGAPKFGSKEDLCHRLHWFFSYHTKKYKNDVCNAKFSEINMCLKQWRKSFQDLGTIKKKSIIHSHYVYLF